MYIQINGGLQFLGLTHSRYTWPRAPHCP